MKICFLFFSLLFLLSCRNEEFDSQKWKTEENEQFYMINDIVNSNRLKGKTKKDIIKLLDTTNIKQFEYNDSSWWFIISKPNARATQSPVVGMYINFENDKVQSVTIDN